MSQYQKGKTNVDFTEARDSEWQWHHHSIFYRPDALPAAQPTVSKHWRHKHWRHRENSLNISKCKLQFTSDKRLWEICSPLYTVIIWDIHVGWYLNKIYYVNGRVLWISHDQTAFFPSPCTWQCMHKTVCRTRDVNCVRIVWMCGQTNLRAHADSRHSKVRRYACSLCSKSFYWKHHVKRHLKACGRGAKVVTADDNHVDTETGANDDEIQDWMNDRLSCLEVHRLSADNRYRPFDSRHPPIIGRLFGADNRPAENQPKHYGCTSSHVVMCFCIS